MKAVFNENVYAKTYFFEWMINRYGVTEDDLSSGQPGFYSAPPREQYRAVSQYFGYPTAHYDYEDPEVLKIEAERHIKDFNRVMAKHGGRVPDMLEKMSHMSNQEITAMHPEMTRRDPNLLMSLCHALVPLAGKSYEMTSQRLPSLRDALVESLSLMPEEEIKPIVEFDYTMTDENAPF